MTTTTTTKPRFEARLSNERDAALFLKWNMFIFGHSLRFFLCVCVFTFSLFALPFAFFLFGIDAHSRAHTLILGRCLNINGFSSRFVNKIVGWQQRQRWRWRCMCFRSFFGQGKKAMQFKWSEKNGLNIHAFTFHRIQHTTHTVRSLAHQRYKFIKTIAFQTIYL